MTTKVTTSADPRVLRTRALLVQALIDLLMKKSFSELTVQEIANKATVNRVTFYAHFPDKLALFHYAVETKFLQVLGEFLEPPKITSKEDVSQLVQGTARFFEMIDSKCCTIDHEVSIMAKMHVQIQIRTMLHDWLQSKHKKCNHDLMLLASFFSGAIVGSLQSWARFKEMSREQACKEIIELLDEVTSTFHHEN